MDSTYYRGGTRRKYRVVFPKKGRDKTVKESCFPKLI